MEISAVLLYTSPLNKNSFKCDGKNPELILYRKRYKQTDCLCSLIDLRSGSYTCSRMSGDILPAAEKSSRKQKAYICIKPIDM